MADSSTHTHPSSNTKKTNPYLKGKSCRVCADDMDLFQQMTKQIHTQTAKSTSSSSSSSHAAAGSGSASSLAVAGGVAAAATTPSSPLRPLPCPPDSAGLGRATWTFLHTMSAYYPDQPTVAQQRDMSSLLTNFAQFYPCPPCAEHLQEHLVQHPPPTQTRSALSLFLCQYHNNVNQRLGKRQFDCSRYDERWRDGPKEDAGYDCIEKSSSSDSDSGY